eukprot:NODE_20_length_39102_cov_0.325513.p7 type:complete len:453 gc:universal NODE_20_length_39102_cov_0.325513:8636-7278(-)
MLSSRCLAKTQYIPGVKGFAESFPQIGPYRKQTGSVEKKLPEPPKISESRLKSVKPHIRYQEELKQIRYEYLKETFSDNQKTVKFKKTENVDGLVGPRRIRKQILLKYPEEQLSVVKRNALMIDILFRERLKLLVSQRDDLILQLMTQEDEKEPSISSESTTRIRNFLMAQIGTAPQVIKTHLDKDINLEDLLFDGLHNPDWKKILSKPQPVAQLAEVNPDRLRHLLTLFHTSESFIAESNLENVVQDFIKNASFEIPSTLGEHELNDHPSLTELMRNIIEDGVVPEKTDDHTGGVDSPSFNSRSEVMSNRALNLFEEESLQQHQNMAKPSAYTPDTADLSLDDGCDLSSLNVSSSAPSVPLHRQQRPRSESYAFNEQSVIDRRMAEIDDDRVPSYSMSKEDKGFVVLPDGDLSKLKKQREQEIEDAYKGTINNKFGVEQVLALMNSEKENK